MLYKQFLSRRFYVDIVLSCEWDDFIDHLSVWQFFRLKLTITFIAGLAQNFPHFPIMGESLPLKLKDSVTDSDRFISHLGQPSKGLLRLLI